MSTLVMSACWPLQLPPAAKAVLISLADNANDEGWCWPSIAYISMRTCLCVRSVKRAIKFLEENGDLELTRRGDERRTTIYRVTHAQGDTVSPMRPRKGDSLSSKGDSLSNMGDTESPGTVKNHQKSNRQESDAASAKRGTRLPPGWTPSDADVEFATRSRPEVDWREEADKFRDYWAARSGADARKVDWPATWRNWIRNSPAPRQQRHQPIEQMGKTMQGIAALEDMKRGLACNGNPYRLPEIALPEPGAYAGTQHPAGNGAGVGRNPFDAAGMGSGAGYAAHPARVPAAGSGEPHVAVAGGSLERTPARGGAEGTPGTPHGPGSGAAAHREGAGADRAAQARREAAAQLESRGRIAFGAGSGAEDALRDDEGEG